MKIVVDAAIPYAEQILSGLGDVTLLPGRDMDAAGVRAADVLVVRTVTRVDSALLSGSNVRFVATATSGTDHVDLEFLDRAGIGFAAAGGCNARAVAEYVLSGLCALAQQQELDLRGKRAGIIGCGHVGTMVEKLLQACGITCLVNDPPLQAQRPGDRDWRELDEVLEADIVSLHVPLVRTGAHPTLNMVDSEFLARLGNDVIFINTSRGEVVDETALCAFLDTHPRAAAVLDVWCNEPAINTALLSRARVGTPHIAGYSSDAKLRATCMVYEQLKTFLGITAPAPPLPTLPVVRAGNLRLSDWQDEMEAIAMAVLGSYDIRSDSASLQRILELPGEQRDGYFDALRNQYPVRREFPAMRVELDHCPESLAGRLSALGFQTVDGRH
jgi:erythronate-4-phosphate dehydrogenase